MDLSLEEKFDAFLAQYTIDMHGDTNTGDGGRPGLVNSVREISKAQLALETKVGTMKEMEEEVKKNTEFRKKVEKVKWEITKYIIWAVVGALLFMVANFIVKNGFTVG